MFKTLSVATVVSLMASASFAGSLNTTYEAEPQKKAAYVPAGSGIGAPAIIGAAVAVVAVGALIAKDDDDESVSDHPTDAD
ncbi:hypothetical protein ABMC88_07070 [Sulfitobacter sp. HNIBRBA2951]|uniref:hypothetical protein n=1 Tax=Sulfitobacter aquimarinus TaxID=3158557 RepID=UPI0032DE8226